MNFPSIFEQISDDLAAQAYPINPEANYDSDFNYEGYVREQRASRTVMKHHLVVAFTTPALTNAAGFHKAYKRTEYKTCSTCNGRKVIIGVAHESMHHPIIGATTCPHCGGEGINVSAIIEPIPATEIV